jgi:hypothetical protein
LFVGPAMRRKVRPDFAKGPHPDLAADMVGPFCERGSRSYTNCALTSALPVLCPRPRPRTPEVTAEVAREDRTGVPQRRLKATSAYLHCECPGSLCSSQKASGICYRSDQCGGGGEMRPSVGSQPCLSLDETLVFGNLPRRGIQGDQSPSSS